MTFNSSLTRTTTSSWSSIKYLNDKIASDLDYIRVFYPDIYSEATVEKWKKDFYNWVYEGYAKTIKLLFIKSDQCICEIAWEIKDDGSISNDDNVGKLKLKGLTGAKPYARVETTPKWDAMTNDQRENFYKTVPGWGPSKSVPYAEGLIRAYDKQYSKGNVGIQRSVLGGG